MGVWLYACHVVQAYNFQFAANIIVQVSSNPSMHARHGGSINASEHDASLYGVRNGICNIFIERGGFMRKGVRIYKYHQAPGRFIFGDRQKL